MSLISEALRKARRETAGRGEDGRRLSPPSGWDRPSSRAPLGVGLVLGATIALAAALAGAAAVWWVIGRTATGSVVAEALESDPRAGAVTPSPAAAAVPGGPEEPAAEKGDRPRTGDGLRAEPVAEITNEGPGERAAVDRFGPGADAPAVGDQGTDNRPAEGRAASSPESLPSDAAGKTPAGPRIFVIDADLGRTTLSLGFIAFRPEDPFAEINGLEIHVGSRIEGLVVEEIARDHVRLSGEEGDIILRVR
jgi:hypothetical protein